MLWVHSVRTATFVCISTSTVACMIFLPALLCITHGWPPKPLRLHQESRKPCMQQVAVVLLFSNNVTRCWYLGCL